MKRCSTCETDRPESDFYAGRAMCRPCCNAKRSALYAETRANVWKTNSTGARGVTYCATASGKKKYRAQCTHDRKYIHLGWFEDVLDAICAASDYRIAHGLNPEERTQQALRS